MARSPDQKAAAIAARQLGLITWYQALITAGLTEHQIRWRISSRRWRKVQPGVYAIEGTTSSWHQTLFAAQLAARTERCVSKPGKQHLEEREDAAGVGKQHLERREEAGASGKQHLEEREDAAGAGKQHLEEREDAAVTGRSALWLRGCKRLGKPDTHELLVGRRRAPTIKGATARRTDHLPPTDVESVDGILTLTVPRLLVDLCGRIPDVDFLAVLDHLLGPDDHRLRDEVHARALQLRHGRKAVDRLVALTAPGAEKAFRSWLERHTAGLFAAAGLPPAGWNVELRDGAGKLIGLGDAVWAEQRVVVELDGLRFHSSSQQRRRDNRKDRRLSAEGWLVLRYTWLDIMERPEETVAEVRAALQRREATLPLSVAASTANLSR